MDGLWLGPAEGLNGIVDLYWEIDKAIISNEINRIQRINDGSFITNCKTKLNELLRRASQESIPEADWDAIAGQKTGEVEESSGGKDDKKQARFFLVRDRRRQIDEKLNQQASSEKQYARLEPGIRAVIESSTIPMCFADTKLTILLYNQPFLDLIGAGKEDITGMPIRDVLKEIHRFAGT